MLYRRSVEFFSRYDLLVGPVTQVAPFPVEWEHPTEIAGRHADVVHRLDGVVLPGHGAGRARPCRCPPAFDGDGLPVGIQLVGAPGADVDVLRAAAALEAASTAAGAAGRR